MALTLSLADLDDAEAIAGIVRATSGGLVDYLLGGLSRFVSSKGILTSLIMESANPFSYENAVVVRADNETVAGLLLAYPAAQHHPPDILRRVVASRKLRHIQGLLEGAYPDSLYVNTLWVDEPYRGTGVAAELLQCALLLAAEQGLAGLSLNVWADNQQAIRFYRRNHFTTVRHCDIPNHPELPHEGGNFLLRRDLSPIYGEGAGEPV
jgi:ribosomal protein S18 acetylase RimI-like enzyme